MNRIGKTTLISGELLSIHAGDTEYVQRSLPAPDSWERWNDDRDRALYAGSRRDYYRRDPYPASVFFSLDFPIYGHSRGWRRRW